MRDRAFRLLALLGMGAVVWLSTAGCTPIKPGGESARGSADQERAADKAQSQTRARQPLILPEGTPVRVRLVPTLSTATRKTGDTFDATLVEPLLVGSRTVASKGASVTGVVVESDAGGRVKGVARIAVQLTGLRTDDGQQIEISTGSVARQARTTKSQDAQKIGIGAGIGAAVGAIAGGGKGAAIGAAAGGGAGTGAVLATRGKAAVLPSETVLNFKLRNAVKVGD